MTKLILLAALATTAASAQAPAPLSLDCHLLLAGIPQPDATTFSVIGRDMFLSQGERRSKISTEGSLLPLGRTVDKGVATHSFADHTRSGTVVTRRVYWQKGTQPRRLAFTERYDFARRTAISTGEGDFCHANGR